MYEGDARGTVSRVDQWLFLVCVSNHQWFMSHGATNKAADSVIEIGSDGRDCFQILYYYEKPKRDEKRYQHPSTVTPGIYPEAVWPDAFAWLAYASGDYFAALKESSLPAPWAIAVADPSSLIYEFKGVFFDDSYRLPKALTWIVSEELVRKVQPGDPVRNYADFMLKGLSTFPPGSTGGVFRVVAWTNFQGQSLPLEFELVRYRVPGPGVYERYYGAARRISIPTHRAGPPEIKGAAGVSDYRWQDPELGIGVIGYAITNQAWPGRDDTNLQAIFELKRKHSSVKPPPQTGIRKAITRVALVLLTIPLVWMLLSKRGFFQRRS
jgi:hypothetical protein